MAPIHEIELALARHTGDSHPRAAAVERAVERLCSRSARSSGMERIGLDPGHTSPEEGAGRDELTGGVTARQRRPLSVVRTTHTFACRLLATIAHHVVADRGANRCRTPWSADAFRESAAPAKAPAPAITMNDARLRRRSIRSIPTKSGPSPGTCPALVDWASVQECPPKAPVHIIATCGDHLPPSQLLASRSWWQVVGPRRR